MSEKYGEHVLETKNNPISIAMTLSSIGDPDDPKGQSISEIGFILFTSGVSETRVITGWDTKVIEGYTFKLHQVQTPSKTPTSNNVSTISVESNSSPSPKKLTYVLKKDLKKKLFEKYWIIHEIL